jgi:hypothetical protein
MRFSPEKCLKNKGINYIMAGSMQSPEQYQCKMTNNLQDLVRITHVIHTRWEATFGLDILPESVCEITASLITE